jgi:hypothetical protein
MNSATKKPFYTVNFEDGDRRIDVPTTDLMSEFEIMLAEEPGRLKREGVPSALIASSTVEESSERQQLSSSSDSSVGCGKCRNCIKNECGKCAVCLKLVGPKEKDTCCFQKVGVERCPACVVAAIFLFPNNHCCISRCVSKYR